MRTIQHRHPKSKPSLAKQITLSGKMTGYVGKGRVVGLAYFDFSKAFDATYPIPKLTQKPRKFGLRKWTVEQGRKWGSKSRNQWLEWSPSGINTTVHIIQCFIRSFDDKAALTLHKCVDDAKSGGVTEMTNSRSLVPSVLRNLGTGAIENRTAGAEQPHAPELAGKQLAELQPY